MTIITAMPEYVTQSLSSMAISQTPAWYAIRTRSRHEKKVAALLEEKRINAYLPLVKEVHRWSDRKKVVQEPLFRGYVFVHILNVEENCLPVLKTPGVAGFVGTTWNGTAIPSSEIENIQTLLSADAPFGVLPFLHAGQRVRIRGGCLNGIEGHLVEVNSQRSVVVSIELIHKSVAIQVSGFDLELV